MERDRTARMYRLYQSGASLKDVGREFGVSEVRVSRLFKAAGLPVRPPGALSNARRERLRRRRVRALEMHEMYRAGATLQQVGDAFGLTNPRVLQIFQAEGLPRRRRSRATEQRIRGTFET